MTAFADIADLPEDDRITTIGEMASKGAVVGFIVEDDVKADRYISKLRRYKVRIVDRSVGPVPGTVLVRVGPAES